MSIRLQTRECKPGCLSVSSAKCRGLIGIFGEKRHPLSEKEKDLGSWMIRLNVATNIDDYYLVILYLRQFGFFLPRREVGVGRTPTDTR